MTKYLVLLGLTGCVAITGVDALEVVADNGATMTNADGGEVDTDAPNTIVPTDDAGRPIPPPKLVPAGVYDYDITGGDQLRGPWTFAKTYASPAKIAVENVDARCLKLTITAREGYVESMNECIIGNDFVQSGGVRDQSFPLVGTVSTTLTCTPGDAYFGTYRPTGKVVNHLCTGANADDKSGSSSFTTKGPFRFVADESLMIAGAPVIVAHYHDERSVSGSQTGTNVADWYFALDSGIVVKLVRKIDIKYGTIFGEVTYAEDLTMTLRALPR